MRTVGILGGMGPEATILLMARVLALTPAQDDADHVPLIVDNNTQVPSRINAIIKGDGEDPGPVLADMARRLEQYGAQALAMPCNTAHHYRRHILDAAGIPFLDMVILSAQAVSREAPLQGRVGILGSPALRITGLYEDALNGEGLHALYPPQEAAVLDAIRRIKVRSDDESAQLSASAAVDALAAAGAQSVLVACTEFSLIRETLPKTVPLIDTMDVLAGAIVAFARGEVADAPQAGSVPARG